jgi:hypothetical protein
MVHETKGVPLEKMLQELGIESSKSMLFNRIFQFRPFQKTAFEHFDSVIPKPRQFCGHVTRILLVGTGAIKNKRLIARKSDGRLESIDPWKTGGTRDMAFLIGFLRIIADYQDVVSLADDHFFQLLAFYFGKALRRALLLG